MRNYYLFLLLLLNSDWIFEEEPDCRDGFRWSPDGTKITYWQSDTKGIGAFCPVNNVDSIYSSFIPFHYPKVGTPNSAVKIGVVSTEGGITKWFDIPGDPQDHYLARMDFIPNSDEVMIQQLNREQNNNRVWIGNTTSMKLNNILTDKDKAYLDIHDNIQWPGHEKYFTWTSEKDGWLRLYLVSRDGQGVAERVTPANSTGHYSYQISGDARWAIHTFHNAVTPPRISLVSLPTHQETRLLEDNDAAKQKFDQLGLNPKEFFKADIGEVVLDGWMIKPIGFDPAKKYPVVFYVYGEPAGTTVQDSWGGGDLWHQYLAQQGYIVISIDNRGTNVPRGAEFRTCIYRQNGILASADQAKAAQKIVAMFNFVDSKRVGIWGWSGGGQMTLNCLFRYPEIYSTGIAVSFVSDQRLYDDNVHYQSFEMVANELIRNMIYEKSKSPN